MKSYTIDWEYEDHFGTPLPERPAGWSFSCVEYDGGCLKLGLTNGPELVTFWSRETPDSFEVESSLDLPHEINMSEDEAAAVWEYGSAMFERLESGAYDAAILVLEKIREDLVDAVLGDEVPDISAPTQESEFDF